MTKEPKERVKTVELGRGKLASLFDDGDLLVSTPYGGLVLLTAEQTNELKKLLGV